MLRILTMMLAAVAADEANLSATGGENDVAANVGEPFEAPPEPALGAPYQAPPTPDYGVAMSETQQLMLEAINEYRAKYGLNPLIPDAYLMNGAQNHSYWMANGGGMVHRYGPYRENIAYGDWTIGGVMWRWSVSPTHNPTMLHPAATHFGGGFSSARGVPYWTQRFRTASTYVATTPATTTTYYNTNNNNVRRRWRPFSRLRRRR